MSEIKGKILAIGNEERVSDKFKKREFVIEEVDGKHPKKICFQLVNDRVDLIDPYQVNETIIVHYNLESKEFNGRWFTNATAWKLEKNSYNNSTTNDEPQF